MRRAIIVALCAALGALSATACESKPQRERCGRCGMYVDLEPSFAARLGDTPYDTPKCLWRDLRDGKGKAVDAQVTEYYTQAKLRADQAYYVVGSDVLGPMGADLIPLKDRGDAERFASEHGGRVIDAAQIDGALLRGL